MRGNRYANLWPFLLALLIMASACGPLDGEYTSEEAARQGFDGFQAAVASDRNYDIYWLGREFEADGIPFWGPDAAGFGDDDISAIGNVEGGGLEMYYLADVADLKLILYSRPAWEHKQKMRSPGLSSQSEAKTVQVNGRKAELRTIFGTFNPIAAQTVVIDFGYTVVEAITRAIIPATPGPQPNPLIDEATFLAVMEHLRPYPE